MIANILAIVMVLIVLVIILKRLASRMWCEYCQEATKHEFIGVQEFPSSSINLYDCVVCGSTHTR